MKKTVFGLFIGLLLAANLTAQTFNNTAVSVVTTYAIATEPGPEPTNFVDTGIFTITRQGPTNAPLTVYFTLGGTASNGVDYFEITSSVTIPEVQFFTRVQVVPKHDELVEVQENVILRLVPGPGYDVSGNSNAVVVIRDPHPVFSDANWSSIGGIDGPYVYIRAAVVDGSSNLYVGGAFTISGVATNIAKWNGNGWSALGSGMTNVYALAVSGTDLYAGGWFARAGGTPVANIARWNGTNWSALGTGVDSRVFALAVSGSNLYAGGYSGIAKWDGSSWSAVPGSGINSIVRALAVSGSDLYAAGDASPGYTSNRVAKWDGSSWSALGSGMNFYVLALAAAGTDLYAGGYFTTAGGTTANLIAKWNGNAWSALGSGLGRTDNFTPSVSALAVSGNDLYAGGNFTTADGGPANYIAKWDGTFWYPLGSGMSGGSTPYVYALAVSGSSLYAGGSFTTAGGKVSAGIAKARIASAARSITASGSSATIQFSGVVGYEYHVQRTDSLTSPMTWTPLTASPLSPAADGSFSFTDTNAPPGTAYYRLVQR
ncbi:MAG TPA: hypothetical protein VFT34_14575 [Verrucomicrobiae bacterium]|nr:hypothetical protein [Verrucomicrobiae bacterium]